MSPADLAPVRDRLASLSDALRALGPAGQRAKIPLMELTTEINLLDDTFHPPPPSTPHSHPHHDPRRLAANDP